MINSNAMNENEQAIEKAVGRVESLEEMLSDFLPNTDRKHKDEILDICELLAQRVETYINDYGVNEGAEI